ncbi:MAG TPA: hypothetical protein VGK99_13770 [Acidobacteriota bacterium]|jgi:hypothetical protein
MELPIACTLTEVQLQERRRTVLDSVGSAIESVEPLPEGYQYTFAPDAGILMLLSHLVSLESQCCRFLTFKIVVEAGGGPIILEVTGPPGAKELIAEFLGGPR